MPSRIATRRVQRANRVRAYSSAVEHLPYKQAVTGSIPVAPTGKTVPTMLPRPRRQRSEPPTSGWTVLLLHISDLGRVPHRSRTGSGVAAGGLAKR
jgi:hypothetical protein